MREAEAPKTKMPPETLARSAQLPALPALLHMSPAERKKALHSWIAWFNGNREHIDDATEQQLDEVLHRLEGDELSEELVSTIQQRFDRWLDEAIQPGAGRGPDEEHEQALP